jgi:drug/metabolite transporter (DMT)-like permease
MSTGSFHLSIQVAFYTQIFYIQSLNDSSFCNRLFAGRNQLTRTKATGMALLSIILWCFSGICFRKGSETIGAMPYLSFMCLTGSITAIVLHITGRKPLGSLWFFPWKVKIAGFIGVTIYTVLLSLAFGRADAADLGQVNLLNYLWPVWIIIGALIILKERPSALLTSVGTLLCLGGIVVSRGGSGLLHAPSNWLPHLLALCGGILWALYSVMIRKWKIKTENGASAFHFFICAITAAAVALPGGGWYQMRNFTGWTLFWILFGGIGPVGIAYHMWEIGMKRGNVSLLASLACLIPVISTFLIGLFFRQALSSWLIPAALMIAVGSILVNLAKSSTNTTRQTL